MRIAYVLYLWILTPSVQYVCSLLTLRYTLPIIPILPLAGWGFVLYSAFTLFIPFWSSVDEGFVL